ncbi:MAG: response regulator transcription factor [Mariprofundaceae bacterium]
MLLVEDEKPTREYLSAMVETQPGLKLQAAVGTLAEARASLAIESPDVLVVDVGLPDGSGVDLIGDIQKLEPIPESLVITVFGDEETVVSALEAGASGYILKEEAFDELGEVIQTVMQGESVISSKVARFLLKRFNNKQDGQNISSEEDESCRLSGREQEVLEYISKGYSYGEIGSALSLSTNTIRAHIRSIYRKLSVSSRSEAVFEAAQMGIIRLNKS